MKSLTPHRLRFIFQALFALFCAYAGFRFILFIIWTTGTSKAVVTKPGAVEGFLPISALMGFRQLLGTGKWDPVHPAGLAIFLAVLIMAFLFRKGFCGNLCPVGFVSSLLERVGRRIGWARNLPRWLGIPLKAIKYLLMAGFVIGIFAMSNRAVGGFIGSSFNMASDEHMLTFFAHPSVVAILVLAALVVLTILVRNFWCRYLCPYGALLGLLGSAGPTAVHRDENLCVNCGKCTRKCPTGIKVQEKIDVRSPECIGCGECLSACPVNHCLSFRVYGKKTLHWATVAVGCLFVLMVIWAWARVTGHWDSTLPPFMLKSIYAGTW